MTRENLTYQVILDVVKATKAVRTEATQPCERLRSLSRRTRKNEHAIRMASEKRGTVRKAEGWPML